MRVTHARNTEPRPRNTTERRLLNVPLWHELMKAKKVDGLRAQASGADVPPSTLSRLLDGETEAQLGTAMKLADYAGVRVELLFPAASDDKAAV